MIGYIEKEVLGKLLKMFQGLKILIVVLKEIRIVIEKQIFFEKIILNYKKNGEIYNCIIYGFFVFNVKGVLLYFIVFEKVV